MQRRNIDRIFFMAITLHQYHFFMSTREEGADSKPEYQEIAAYRSCLYQI
jgi:hypothetical protein